MTRTKKALKRLLLATVLLLFIMIFTALPVYAAEGDEGAAGDDTTGTTEASVRFEAGELKLEQAPMLDFGTQAISYEAQEYAATSVSSNVQISDLRGNGAGWDLFVSLSPFRLETNGEPTLKAASIQITAPTVNAVNGTIGTPPKALDDITLTSDSTETPVWRAAPGEGMGVWDLGWEAANIKLKVKPGTAEEGKGVATITWSLQSTP